MRRSTRSSRTTPLPPRQHRRVHTTPCCRPRWGLLTRIAIAVAECVAWSRGPAAGRERVGARLHDHAKGIRFSSAVKNVGEGAAQVIVEAAARGGLRSLDDFCDRLSLQRTNKRVIESLIKSARWIVGPRLCSWIARSASSKRRSAGQRAPGEWPVGLFAELGISGELHASSFPAPTAGSSIRRREARMGERAPRIYLSAHPTERARAPA